MTPDLIRGNTRRKGVQQGPPSASLRSAPPPQAGEIRSSLSAPVHGIATCCQRSVSSDGTAPLSWRQACLHCRHCSLKSGVALIDLRHARAASLECVQVNGGCIALHKMRKTLTSTAFRAADHNMLCRGESKGDPPPHFSPNKTNNSVT